MTRKRRKFILVYLATQDATKAAREAGYRPDRAEHRGQALLKLPEIRGEIARRQENPPRRGRPSLYTEELADSICDRIAVGHSLVRICEDPDMPDYRTVTKWLEKRPDFVPKYSRARESQADYYADSITRLADEAVGLDGAGVAAKRLQVEARKWVASKLLPKRYGDHLDVNGQVNVTHDLAARLAKAIERANCKPLEIEPPTIEHEPAQEG